MFCSSNALSPKFIADYIIILTGQI